MNRRIPLFAGLALAFLAGCTGGQSGNEGFLGPDGLPCEDTTMTAVGWTQETSLGVTAAEAFSSVAGTCSAPFSWRAGGFEGTEQASEPPTGKTQVHVDVEPDQESAQLLEPTTEHPMAFGCESKLSIGAHLRIRTDDGVLVDEGDVTIVYPGLLRFERAADEIGGSLSLDSETAELRYELDGAGENCAGTVSLALTNTMDEVGSWSASGCAPGEQLVELEEWLGQDSSRSRAQIDEAFADVRLDGTWDDGTRTTLALSAKLAATQACANSRGLELPVDVRYGTDDGVIATHDMRTTMELDPPGSSESVGFWLNDRQACEGESDDTLAYSPADCGVVTDVLIDFNLVYVDGVLTAGDDGLNVYENLRHPGTDGDSQRRRNFTFDDTE